MIKFYYRKTAGARLLGFVEPVRMPWTGTDRYRPQVRAGQSPEDKEWDRVHEWGNACECGRGHAMLSCTAE